MASVIGFGVVDLLLASKGSAGVVDWEVVDNLEGKEVFCRESGCCLGVQFFALRSGLRVSLTLVSLLVSSLVSLLVS